MLVVGVFLVIASYFLTSKFLKTEQSEISVGEVFLHRIKRLYPAYLTIVFLFTVVLFAHTRRVNPESLWYILSLQNFRVLFDHATYDLDGFLGHFWYIGLDVWLFLLWVVIMRMVPRKYLKVAFVISVIFGIAWRTSFILMGKYGCILCDTYWTIGLLGFRWFVGIEHQREREKQCRDVAGDYSGNIRHCRINHLQCISFRLFNRRILSVVA